MMWEAATFILIAGMVDDFRSRKVHNVLVVALFAAAAVLSLITREFSATAMGLAACGLALGLSFPLYMTGVLGAGDVKLFAVFAFAVNPHAACWTLGYSVIWGSVFGVARATLHGHLPVLVRNTYKAVSRQKPVQQEIQKIPYTFALLLGWFTYVTMMRAGGV